MIGGRGGFGRFGMAGAERSEAEWSGGHPKSPKSGATTIIENPNNHRKPDTERRQSLKIFSNIIIGQVFHEERAGFPSMVESQFPI